MEPMIDAANNHFQIERGSVQNGSGRIASVAVENVVVSVFETAAKEFSFIFC